MMVTLLRWISNFLSIYTIALIVLHLPRRRYVYGPHGFLLSPKRLDWSTIRHRNCVKTLLDKKNYVCHYGNLKFYFNHGLVVDKMHRLCEFEQSKWLGVYIEKNTVMRKQAVNDFEKKLYKLRSNACFGKTMENLRKRSKITFLSNPQQPETFAQRATFKSFQFIKQALVCVFQKLFCGLDQANSCRRFYSRFDQVITLQISLRRSGTSILVRSHESCLQRHRFAVISNTNSGSLQRHGLF